MRSAEFPGNSPEVKNNNETRTITPYDLMNSNQSNETAIYRERFEENRKAGKLTLDWECSDARNWRLTFEDTFYYHTIANGQDPGKLQQAANSDVTDLVIVTAHDPCGGRTAKNTQLVDGVHIQDTSKIEGYISCEVDHPSVKQAGVQAKKLSQMTEKRVAAMVRNHETGELQVLAEFNRNDSGIISRLPEDTFDKPAPKSAIEDDRIDYLDFNEVSDVVWEYHKRYEDRRLNLLAENPKLPQQLKVQNPRMIKLSTDLRAAEIWIPHFAGPGNIFRLTTPRDRIQLVNGEKTTILSPFEINLAWAQAQYVIGHTVKNRGLQNEPFSDTDTFLIATPEYTMSQSLALNLAQKPFMHDWIKDERNKILVAQNNAGNFRRIAEMRFKIENESVAGFEEVDAVSA